MQGFIILIFISLFLLLVITYPYKITWRFHINLIKNIGYIVFKVLFIRLLCERFKINDAFEFEQEKENVDKKDNLFFRCYVLNLANRVNVKKVDLFCDIGLKEEAFFLSLFSGCFDVGLSCVVSALLNRYKNIKIYKSVEPYFNEERFEFTGKIIVSFNVIDVIISLICAMKLYLKIKRRSCL